jgi:hypothetical protein
VGVLCQLILAAIFFVLQLAGAALVRAPPKVLLPIPMRAVRWGSELLRSTSRAVR